MTPTLDFAHIRKSCPNAFALLIAWFCQGKHFQYTPTAKSPGPDAIFPGTPGPWIDTEDGTLSLGDTRYAYDLNVRDLFDFFDASGVFVSVQLLLWQYDISTFAWLIRWHGNIHIDQSQYPTRAEAEAAAFGAGFVKLEEMLNQKGK